MSNILLRSVYVKYLTQELYVSNILLKNCMCQISYSRTVCVKYLTQELSKYSWHKCHGGLRFMHSSEGHPKCQTEPKKRLIVLIIRSGYS